MTTFDVHVQVEGKSLLNGRRSINVFIHSEQLVVEDNQEGRRLVLPTGQDDDDEAAGTGSGCLTLQSWAIPELADARKQCHALIQSATQCPAAKPDWENKLRSLTERAQAESDRLRRKLEEASTVLPPLWPPGDGAPTTMMAQRYRLQLRSDINPVFAGAASNGGCEVILDGPADDAKNLGRVRHGFLCLWFVHASGCSTGENPCGARGSYVSSQLPPMVTNTHAGDPRRNRHRGGQDGVACGQAADLAALPPPPRRHLTVLGAERRCQRQLEDSSAQGQWGSTDAVRGGERAPPARGECVAAAGSPTILPSSLLHSSLSFSCAAACASDHCAVVVTDSCSPMARQRPLRCCCSARGRSWKD
jgi:hypothetical protein|eukprot:COSAG01_NODE_353_length_18421_cov_15.217716_6_plen_362_part_00